MTTTDLRNTQLAADAGVARAVAAADRGRIATGNGASTVYGSELVFGTTFGCGTATPGVWSLIDAKPMSKVDLHPDRWPLLSPS